MIGTPSEVILRSILTLRKTLTDQEYRLFATALSLLIRGLPPGELEVVCGAAASEIRRHRPVPVWRTASQDVQLKMKRTIDDLINRHKMDPVPALIADVFAQIPELPVKDCESTLVMIEETGAVSRSSDGQSH